MAISLSIVPLVDFGSMQTINTIMWEVKAKAFDLMDPFINIAILFVALAGVVSIVQTTTKLSSGKPVDPWHAARFLIVLLIVANFNTLIVKPMDYIFSTIAPSFEKAMIAVQDETKLNDALAMKWNNMMNNTPPVVSVDSTSSSFGLLPNDVRAAVAASAEYGEVYIDAVGKSWKEKAEHFFRSIFNIRDAVVQMACDLISSSGLYLISGIVSLLRIICALCICIFAGLYLTLIGLIGPFVFAFGIMTGFESGIQAWFARYIQISFWVPITQLIGVLKSVFDYTYISTGGDIIKVQDFFSFGGGFSFGGVMAVVADICIIVMFLSVPNIAKWIINSSGADGVAGKATQMGSSAAKTAATIGIGA